ncbi:hypothetical protein FRX31_008444 [Thalictrum thalictroides]|uniref:NAC domain-containing protein n=1 Tax=Thalictrum thalictroides TaxID=46969 RepID=A0A7J6WWZ7_THATH|nr:hypothetical protein FRX31_008444 [Thalictrum thalictroides]
MAILSCEKAKEEEEATVLLLPPGFTFRPTDIELLTYYLSKKINGDEDLPNIIVERKLYGKETPEPWKIFDEGITTAVEEVKYFYTWAIKKHGSKKNYFDRVCGQGKWKMDRTYPILDSENRLLGFKKLFSFDNFDKDKYGSWVLWEYTLNTADPNNQQELTVCKMHRGTIGKKKAKQDRELMNMPCNKKRTRMMNESAEPASRSSTKMLKQTTNKESSLPAPSTPLVIEKPVVLQYGGLSFPSTFEGTTAELTFGDVDLMQQDYQPQPQPREQLCTNINDETTSCSQIDVYQPQPDQGVPATCPQPDDDNQCVYGACTQSDDQPIAQSGEDVPAAHFQLDNDECAFGVENLSYLDNPEFLCELQNVVGDDVDDTAQEEDGLYEFFGELSSTR